MKRAVAGGTGPLSMLVIGQPLPAAIGRRTLFFEPDGPGFVRLTVMDARGATDSVMVRLVPYSSVVASSVASSSRPVANRPIDERP